jgi:hypothetical protein
LRRGVTSACLKGSGNLFSERERLTRLVIGTRREGRQAFKRKVGITSREHEASEEARTADLISSGVAGRKRSKIEGVEGGEILVKELVALERGKAEHNLEILSLKKFRNDFARIG